MSACCSCGAMRSQQPTACPTCRARWGITPVATMIKMGDEGIHITAQTVQREDVEAFCARLREMAR